MKRIVAFILLTLIVGVTQSFSAQSKWKEIKPKKFDKKVTINVSENERIYYSASDKDDVTIEITGPSTIRILTRLELPKEKAKNYKYSVLYKKDKKKTKTKHLKTKPSKQASMKNGQKLGQSRSFYLKVPKGKHRYTFSSKDAQVYLRFFRKKITWVHYTPKGKKDIITLQYQEKELPYIRLKGGDNISLDLYGPTKVKVISRLEYTSKMTGELSYRLQVSENAEVINSYNLTTYKSETTTYKEKSDLIPARKRTFYFYVPKGKHEYKIKLLETDYSALLRFFIPKNHVNNSGK